MYRKLRQTDKTSKLVPSQQFDKENRKPRTTAAAWHAKLES